MKTLAAVHFAGNALLLWLGYYWLGVGESRTSSLLWSAVIALVLLCLTCWLHGATFAFFAGQEGGVTKAFRAALRNLPALLAAVVVILLLYYAMARWSAYSSMPSFTIASWLTSKLRKPVKPNSVLGVFSAATWLVRWVVIPLIVLPWVAAIAFGGWRGFLRRLPTGRAYWIEAPVLLVCAFWLPFVVLNWVPYTGKFPVEVVSFVIRLLVAYLLFVAAWLALVFLTSGGKPAWSHASTAGKP